MHHKYIVALSMRWKVYGFIICSLSIKNYLSIHIECDILIILFQ